MKPLDRKLDAWDALFLGAAMGAGLTAAVLGWMDGKRYGAEIAGAPVGAVTAPAHLLPCDTDSDCAARYGGDGGPAPAAGWSNDHAPLTRGPL